MHHHAVIDETRAQWCTREPDEHGPKESIELREVERYHDAYAR